MRYFRYQQGLLIRPIIQRLYKQYLTMSVVPKNASNLQIKQMNENIPIVNNEDTVLGPSTKRNCHERGSTQDGILHRAFSVFLFNSDNKLLLQQRSASKITFPNYYTNSCCSHPRYNKEELDEHNNIGIKIAAQRRLNDELGIPHSDVSVDFYYIFRGWNL